MKIVINTQFGGFSLSHEAIMLYGEKMGWSLQPGAEKFFVTTYWKTSERCDQSNWDELSLEERKASNEKQRSLTFYDRDLERNDPVLVRVVEELGPSANGRFADLKIVEIPDEVEWVIEEYDGIEWVAEKHRTWS